jgi:hypothetical protein
VSEPPTSRLSVHPQMILLDDRETGIGDDHRRRLAVILILRLSVLT